MYTAASSSGNVEVLKKSHELNHRCIIHDGTQPLKHQISVAYGQVIFYKEFLTTFGVTYNSIYGHVLELILTKKVYETKTAHARENATECKG